jgi:hypothetical protein
MKKLSTFLAIVISFYGVAVITPTLVFADNGSDSNGKNNQSEMRINNKNNHGSFVSSFARFFSWIGKNHGQAVSSVAKDNYGQNKGDKNENGNEHGQPGSYAFYFTNIKAVPNTNSSVISWSTNQPTSGTIFFGTNSGSLTSNLSENGSLLLSHQLTLIGLIPDTTYFYYIKSTNATSTSIQSGIRSFHTLVTSTPSDITAPNILFATNLGLSTSTTSLIWVTNETSNSNIWFGTTTPVATTTAPMVTSGALSFFHQLSLPGLATSTLYFYTISSTDASNNTTFYSNSFTTPAI